MAPKVGIPVLQMRKLRWRGVGRQWKEVWLGYIYEKRHQTCPLDNILIKRSISYNYWPFQSQMALPFYKMNTNCKEGQRSLPGSWKYHGARLQSVHLLFLTIANLS